MLLRHPLSLFRRKLLLGMYIHVTLKIAFVWVLQPKAVDTVRYMIIVVPQPYYFSQTSTDEAQAVLVDVLSRGFVVRVLFAAGQFLAFFLYANILRINL